MSRRRMALECFRESGCLSDKRLAREFENRAVLACMAEWIGQHFGRGSCLAA